MSQSLFAHSLTEKRPSAPEEPTPADTTFQKALDALESYDYVQCHALVEEALKSDPPISDSSARAYALNLRGTFQFLMGDARSAKESFEQSIAASPNYANSYVKLASVHMDLGETEGTFETYEKAVKADPNDPDVYYQRGQVFFIMGDFNKAATDYQKSIDLDPAFVFSHIQLAVAQYKLGNIGKSMATFRATMREFPTMSEPLNY
jgi:import receptor subunit TOM70